MMYFPKSATEIFNFILRTERCFNMQKINGL